MLKYCILLIVYYANGNLQGQKSREYIIWATSATEAEAKAQKLCEYDFGNAASCGGARTTGRSGPAN